MAVSDLPPDVVFRRVVMQIGATVGDGIDPGRLPEVKPVIGTATITPSMGRTVDASIPITLLPQAVKCVFANGILCDEESAPTSGSPSDTDKGVWLACTDNTSLNPTNFTYRIDFRFSTFSLNSFSFEVPTGGSDLDLSLVIPVSSANGSSIIRGPEGPPGPPGEGTLATMTDNGDGTITLEIA